MALLADELKQLIGEGGRCGGGRHELDDMVSRTRLLGGCMVLERRYLSYALRRARQYDLRYCDSRGKDRGKC